MKKEYKSALRSKKWIREAYLDLLKTKEQNDITITDIVSKADINRSTFYAHYAGVWDIDNELQDEIIAKMLEILKNFKYNTFFDNPAPMLLELSRLIEQDLDMYKLLLSTSTSNNFIEKLKKVFVDYMFKNTDFPTEIKHTLALQIRITYFAGGIVNAYINWLRGELDCSANDIALEISKLLKSESSDLIK